MFAALKIVGVLVIACGSAIAAIVESTHPAFCACFCMACALGAIAAEALRVRRRRSVRWSARRANFREPIAVRRTAPGRPSLPSRLSASIGTGRHEGRVN